MAAFTISVILYFPDDYNLTTFDELKFGIKPHIGNVKFEFLDTMDPINIFNGAAVLNNSRFINIVCDMDQRIN